MLSGLYARLGEPQRACELLTRAIDAGFLCAPAFETDVYLTSLRATADWQPLLDRLTTSRRRVTNEFARAGGRALLGLGTQLTAKSAQARNDTANREQET